MMKTYALAMRKAVGLNFCTSGWLEAIDQFISDPSELRGAEYVSPTPRRRSAVMGVVPMACEYSTHCCKRSGQGSSDLGTVTTKFNKGDNGKRKLPLTAGALPSYKI